MSCSIAAVTDVRMPDKFFGADAKLFITITALKAAGYRDRIAVNTRTTTYAAPLCLPSNVLKCSFVKRHHTVNHALDAHGLVVIPKFSPGFNFSTE